MIRCSSSLQCICWGVFASLSFRPSGMVLVEGGYDPTAPTVPEDEVLYQDKDGHLCINDDCWDSNDQHGILQNQLWYWKNEPDITCKDLLDDVCSSITTHDCALDPVYLHSYCPRSCGVCHNRTRVVKESMEKKPIRITDSRVVYDAIGSDIGVPQVVRGTPKIQDEIRRLVEEAQDYVTYTINDDDRYAMVRDKCRNLHQDCASWAVEGQCETNEDYMLTKCAPVCYTCDELHYTARCPIDQNHKHAWYPGDLNAMFERIVSDPYYNKVYDITVLSRPDLVDGDTEETASYKLGPWMVLVDNFTKPEEAEKLIEAGGVIGYERSEDVGEEGHDGEVGGVVSTGRTSENAWCDPEACESEPLVQDVIARMENLTAIHRNYSETLQLLRYEVGQFYEEHHDYTDIDYRRAAGSRILTVFLYLNDVEKGGGTNFPRMDLTVQPKLGRAVLWPSVLDEDPHTRDDRTHHQALPVEKGVKYGANAWIHQRKYRVVLENGC